MEILAEIQQKVIVPKKQFNKLGNYYYRNCEDIIDAAKKVLNPMGLALMLNDEMVECAGKAYVKSIVSIIGKDGKAIFSTTASACEETFKKGVDASQRTGMASSYARKRALEGLFALDDTKDGDFIEAEVEPELTREQKRLVALIVDATDLNQLEKFKNKVTPEIQYIFDNKAQELKGMTFSIEKK